MADLRRSQWLAEGTAAFGRDSIEAIVESLDDGFVTAATTLDYDGPKGPVELYVVTDALQQASDTAVWGTHDQGVIRIGLNPCSSVEDIVAVIPRYGCHEMAHKIHFGQPAPRASWGLGIPFMKVIVEGFATHTEQTLHDNDYWPASYLNLTPQQRSAHDGHLLRAMYGSGSTAPDYFRQDDDGVNVYEVGTYVVGLMSVVHDLAPRDLVKLPLVAFQDFAEHEL